MWPCYRILLAVRPNVLYSTLDQDEWFEVNTFMYHRRIIIVEDYQSKSQNVFHTSGTLVY